MKYIVILSDGMGDYPIAELDGKTPLQAAKTPNFNALAKLGTVGLAQSVPDGMSPGSDVANLAMLGYDPSRYYTGRSPIEAASMGIELGDKDTAMRCNLVTLSEEVDFFAKRMLDYSAGEISTPEAEHLIKAIDSKLGQADAKFYNGVSYRHCLVINGESNTSFTPPHNISGLPIKDYLPQGEGAQRYLDFIRQSEQVLASHPINAERRRQGKTPATHIWLWGQGKRPTLDSFYEKFGLKGAIISAVDLLKGIAKLADMQSIDVKGATGTLSTNFVGKANACLDALAQGRDFVYLHLEAPDECGHQKDLQCKMQAIEKVDMVVGIIWQRLKALGEDYTICVTADHFTPLSIGTHTRDAVPFVIYRSNKEQSLGIQFNEKDAQRGIYMPSGMELMDFLIKGDSA